MNPTRYQLRHPAMEHGAPRAEEDARRAGVDQSFMPRSGFTPLRMM